MSVDFKVDHDLSGISPDIIIDPRKPNQMILRSELVGHHPTTRRTGRFVHLGMTAADAMRLLALLKDVQKQQGWADPVDPVQSTAVPPAKDRN